MTEQLSLSFPKVALVQYKSIGDLTPLNIDVIFEQQAQQLYEHEPRHLRPTRNRRWH